MKKKRRNLIIIIMVLAAIIMAIIFTIYNRSLIKKESYYTEPQDAEEYYSHNGELLNVVTVSESENIQTEKEVLDDLVARGFEGCEVYSEYGMNGNYISSDTPITSSGRKHPSYYFYYQVDESKMWTVYFINGKVMATLFSLNNEIDREIILSEDEYLISYDGPSNSFYETIPNSDVVDMVLVSHIDAESLRNYHFE